MQMRTRGSRAIVALMVGLATSGALGAARALDNDSERYLYVWSGDQARRAPDFLAVVDFDPQSPKYGRVITTRPLPGPGAAGNEPHHVGLSRARRRCRPGLLRSQRTPGDLLRPLMPACRGSSRRPIRRRRRSPTSSTRCPAAGIW